jgi:mannan endo-1,4-beta-mannosidase
MSRALLGLLLGVVVIGGIGLGLFVARLDPGQVDQIDALIPEDMRSTPSPTPTPAPTPTPTPEPLSGKILPPDAPDLYWGAHTPEAPDPAAVDDLQERVGRMPAVLMWYVDWEGETPFPVDEAQDLAELGVVPMVTWEPWDPTPDDPAHSPQEARQVAEQPDFRLQRIVDGEFDDYIEAFAGQIIEYGGPLFLRFAHEMDGFWYPWGGTVNDNDPADYVRAWIHVHDLVVEAGATNVTWVWSVNHLSVPDEPENQIDNYWPGADYVDWIGVSGFNFGDAAETPQWRTFDEIYAERLVDLEEYDKPVMVTEIASVEGGGDKGAWIEDAIQRVIEHEEISAIVWFDVEVEDLKDWRIDSSDAALEAFRDALDHDEVVSGPWDPGPPAEARRG